MSKFIYVNGENEFSAMEMEQTGELKNIANIMNEQGTTFLESEDGSRVRLLEFGDVDDGFLWFILNNLCDYDFLKQSSVYKLEDWL